MSTLKSKSVYEDPLPIGFEPPPGYVRGQFSQKLSQFLSQLPHLHHLSLSSLSYKFRISPFPSRPISNCLERLTLDNSSHLDENIRAYGISTAMRAMQAAIDGPVRKLFHEELCVLRHITTVKEVRIVSTTQLPRITDVPDVGVVLLVDLTSWFMISIASRISNIALVPDQDADVLLHLAMCLLTSFSFRKWFDSRK